MSQDEQAYRVTKLTKRAHDARARLAECRKKAPVMAEQFGKLAKAIDDDQIKLAAVLVKECPSTQEFADVILGIESSEQEIAECEQDIARLIQTPVD